MLSGEMSIVGPRPHATAHNDMFAGYIPPLARRHNVKPGITGWAQVNGCRGGTDSVEKVEERNMAYFKKFPEDGEKVRLILDYLITKESTNDGVTLSGGGKLTRTRLQRL